MPPASRIVFRCFKAMERAGDRLTGAAGRYFVMFAITLIFIGVVCFVDVILPSLSYPILTAPFCILVALNLIVHYWYVCTISPGYVEDPTPEPGHGITWAKPSTVAPHTPGVRWSNDIDVTPASITKCRKCTAQKPERAHHCRICKRCVLKYDHHCPWINQCVGIYNEKHFVMFMAYLVLATFCYSVLGYTYVMESIGLTYEEWSYRVPAPAFLMIYILCVVLCLAVGVMCAWHVWSIGIGETSVEGQDHDVYRRVATGRGESFTNSYDLGRRKNLELFFHVGENGYPWYTLILPLRTMPYTDGRSWARRPGHSKHKGVREGEELTDEEDPEQ